jgi:tetratricopeptide (TPR) repeat protein
MKLFSLFTLLSSLLFSTYATAQKNNMSAAVDSLTNLGIAFHDDKNYADAISTFEKALKLNKKDPRANYELANTLIVVGRFKDAIKYVDKVLDSGDTYGDQAYTLKATALDYLDEPQKAIKTYKEGIAKYPADHMLPFNLSVTLLKTSAYAEAEQYAEKAVLAKKTHPGSNLMLGYANYYQNNRSETLMALYHFLLLETDTKRAKTAWSIVESVLKLGIKKESENQINLSINADARFTNSDMSLMISQIAPDSLINPTKASKFAFINSNFFKTLAISEKADAGSVYNKIYVPFFTDLQKAGFTEVFSYYISQPDASEETSNWLKDHNEELEKFADWVNARLKM